MTMNDAPQKRYVILVSLLTCLILLAVYAINYIVVPLWYAAGNSLAGINYPYNERLSKSNLFLQNPDQYDCVIFGSSRTVVIDVGQIKGYHCFNFAISAGKINQYVRYAKWIKRYKSDMRLIIVGLDFFNFLREEEKDNVPEFVIEQHDPTSIFKTYLSVDALKFSIDTINKKPAKYSIYDGDFIGRVEPGLPEYKPSWKRSAIRQEISPDLIGRRIALYAELNSLFPGALYIGYVPPLSVWDLHNDQVLTGTLDSMLDAVHQASKFMDRAYDFSIPAAITNRTDNTFDGSHYDEQTNKFIVEVINDSEAGKFWRIDDISIQEYRDKVHNNLIEFSHALSGNESVM